MQKLEMMLFHIIIETHRDLLMEDACKIRKNYGIIKINVFNIIYLDSR
jgi:hypothetical protein